MRIRLTAAAERRSYDTGLARFTDAETIPCFRCGVCCQRWQPLVGRIEAGRLAAHLQMDHEQFLVQYARVYPFEEDTHQLLEQDGGCIFLHFDGGLASCSVHDARPQACRDWDASLLRDECLAGLRTAPTVAGLLIPLAMYDDEQDQRAFIAHLQGGGCSNAPG